MERLESTAAVASEVFDFCCKPPITDAEFAQHAPQVKELIQKSIAQNSNAMDVVEEASNNDPEPVEQSPAPNDKPDPRAYQLQFLEIAKQRNTIVHLGTGTGKSTSKERHVPCTNLCPTALIALLLIQHYLSLPQQGRQQTVFLVPSVPLAYQQESYLRANLPCSVAIACDLTLRTRRDLLVTSRVLVATHGAYLELLRHFSDQIGMRQVDLLVLDECHNCVGNSPYAVILRDFYHGLERKPRVLGLTASPLINVKVNHGDSQLEERLAALEGLMDSRIVSLEHKDDPFIKDVEEEVVSYDALQWSLVQPSLDTLHPTRFKDFRQLVEMGSELGPGVLGLYCESLLTAGLTRNTFENESEEQFLAAKMYLEALCKGCKTSGNALAPKMEKLGALLQLEVAAAEDPIGVVFVQRRVTALALEHYFLQQQNPSTDGNVGTMDVNGDNRSLEVVDQRGETLGDVSQTAESTGMFDDADPDVDPTVTLGSPCQDRTFRKRPPTEVHLRSIHPCSLIRKGNKFSKFARDGHLTDAQKKVFEEEQHQQESDMKRVLRGLRDGKLNVLIATSVAEEGVDLQACSFVVVFDDLTTVKSYIQMKGRARQRSAKFFCFQDWNTNNTSRLKLKDAKRLEHRVKAYIVDSRSQDSDYVPSHPLHAGLGVAGEVDASEAEMPFILQGFYASSLARVTLDSAKSLLYRYSNSQPIDPSVRLSRQRIEAYWPCFTEDYNTLMLPAYIGSSLNLRIIKLPKQMEARKKTTRQQILSLIACIRIHRQGLLSDRLLPLTHQELQERMIRECRSLDSFPNVESSRLNLGMGRKCYVSTIVTQGSLLDEERSLLGNQKTRLALITFGKKSSCRTIECFHKQFGSLECGLGVSYTFECQPDQKDLMLKFFAMIMNSRWKRRTRNAWFDRDTELDAPEPEYAIACVDQQSAIDWEKMRHLLARAHLQEMSPGTIPGFQEAMLCCRAESPLETIIPIRCTDLCISSKLPGSEVTWLEHFGEASETLDPETKLYECQRCWKLPSSQSDVNDQDAKETHDLPMLLLPLQMCRELPMSDAALFLETLLLPLLLFEVELCHHLQAFKTFVADFYPRLHQVISLADDDQILKVLSTPSFSADSNYEHLEWLGDGFLKLACSDSIVHSSTLKDWIKNLHEGDLSELRSVLTCNDKLQQVCEKCGLVDFILHEPLARGKWCPSPLVLRNADGVVALSSKKKDKFKADFVEALLGLCYKLVGHSGAVSVAEELCIILQFEKQDTSPSLATAPRPPHVRAMEDLTGHMFRDLALAHEACTHPTSFDPTTSSYQRLEWVGDAALCLAVRDWLFERFPLASVGSLVTAEAAIVSNNLLAYLSLCTGIHKHLRHQDKVLPQLIERYEESVKSQRRRLWSTDPPKAMADIVEAIFGAVFLDAGWEASQAAVLRVLSSVLSLFDYPSIDETNPGAMLSNPKHELLAVSGELIKVKCKRSRGDFVPLECPCLEATEGTSLVATATGLGCPILQVRDISYSSSVNRLCAFVLRVFAENETLLKQLKEERTRLRSC